jgi:hypothetical protein
VERRIMARAGGFWSNYINPNRYQDGVRNSYARPLYRQTRFYTNRAGATVEATAQEWANYTRKGTQVFTHPIKAFTGEKSAGFWRTAMRQTDRAVSGLRSGKMGPPTRGGRYGFTAAIKIGSEARKAYAGRAFGNIVKAATHLPLKTKIGLPLAAAGIYGWMHNRKKDKMYTHYFDF